MRRFILASRSPRRSHLLREAGYHPEVIPAAVEELQSEHLTPEELSSFNAHRKALAVARLHPDAVVLGADTLVVLGTRVFGKPKTMAEAAEMLGLLAGKTHEVFTAASIIHMRERKVFTEAVSSEVQFQTLDSTRIERYLSMVEPLDKAGAYAVQQSTDSIIERVEGSVTNVMGLPMELISEILPWFGILPDERSDLPVASPVSF